jgi:hypothetical protein
MVTELRECNLLKVNGSHYLPPRVVFSSVPRERSASLLTQSYLLQAPVIKDFLKYQKKMEA